MKQRLAHISFLVRDYDEALRFFVEGLNWVCLADEDQGRKRWVCVAPKGAQTGLILARADTPAQAALIGNQHGGRVGFFLHTDDFGATADLIKRAGGQFCEDPREEVYGRVAVWRDPWGNLWDLIQTKVEAS